MIPATAKNQSEGGVSQMGTPSPYPWDLPLSRQNDCFWGGLRRPAIPAPRSALQAHPCVAVPSARVRSV
jgi:hypothetical protein